MRRLVVVDAGPLKAAIDANDPAHAWAVHAFKRTPARFVTCEAAITESLHLLENDQIAVTALRRLCARMEVVAMGSRLDAVFELVEQFAPRMDFADACAVALARGYHNAFVLTTDFRDFSTYRVPFACPDGAFHA